MPLDGLQTGVANWRTEQRPSLSSPLQTALQRCVHREGSHAGEKELSDQLLILLDSICDGLQGSPLTCDPHDVSGMAGRPRTISIWLP